MPLPGGDRGGYGTVEVHRHQANAGPVQAVVVVAGAELPPGVPPPVVVFHRTGRLRCGKMRENGKSSVRLLVFEHGGGLPVVVGGGRGGGVVPSLEEVILLRYTYLVRVSKREGERRVKRKVEKRIGDIGR